MLKPDLASELKKLAAKDDNLKYYVTLGATSGATGAVVSEIMGLASMSRLPVSIKRIAIPALAGAIATPVAVRFASPLLGKKKVEISRKD